MQKLSQINTERVKPLRFSPFLGNNEELVKYSGVPEVLENKDISFLHFHNEIEIGYCIKGTGTCVIGEKIYTFSSGDYIVIAPDIPHYHKAISEDDCICNFIFFDFEKIFSHYKIDSLDSLSFLSTDIPSQVIRSSDADELLTPLKDILNIATNLNDSNFSELLICFFLLSERLKKYGSSFEFSKSNPKSQKLAPAINLITLEYASSLSVQDLANACYMSKSNFMKAFGNVFGISAYAFLNKFRVYAAREMLIHTDYAVAYISEACGFSSFSNFFRQFKKYFKSSPAEYRTKQKKNLI